jgi:hypothetical protein
VLGYHDIKRIVENIAIEAALARLESAIACNSSRLRCLRLWSEFVRLRDGHRCVDCHSRERLSAHHICRKSLLAGAQFETGNGITLCRDCHKEAHGGFNGRPDLSLPVDSQGGEKLELMERFYSILLDDAVERGLLRDEFYFLGDNVLGTFKKIQGFNLSTMFPGSRLEQAYLILSECEEALRNAVAKANGFSAGAEALLPGGIMLCFDDSPATVVPNILQIHRPRST